VQRVISVLIACLGVVFASLSTPLSYLRFSLAAPEVYKDSVALAEASPDTAKMLGPKIEAKSIPLGSFQTHGESRFAQWSVKLGGLRGRGHLYGAANFTRGAWEYSRLELVSENGKDRIDLTPSPVALKLPPVPTRQVYLLPVGPGAGQSLDWAPAYYKAMLGAAVTVLPPVPEDTTIADKVLGKIDGDRCIDLFERSHPEIVRDPFAIIIGVVSDDLIIPGMGYDMENYRSDGRFAVVSVGRIRPPDVLGRLNPAWLDSRVQKLITKNLVILYYGLPLSSDGTSLLAAGILSGDEIDQMSTEVIGAEGLWEPFTEGGQPGVSIFDVPGKPVLWQRGYEARPLADTKEQFFVADLSSGLFIQHKIDFLFDDDFSLQFERVYTSMDQYSRNFGIGAANSLEMHLIGQMGTYVDLVMADGSRAHFERDAGPDHTYDTYVDQNDAGKFWKATAEYMGLQWRVTLRNGWTYFFPYHREWGGNRMTMLGSFSDPGGHIYQMKRDGATGDLTDISTPSQKWLHFENDSRHRIVRITSSTGRTMTYEYDADGRLTRAKASDGSIDAYTYDDRGQMLTASHGAGAPVLKNEYFADNYVKSQTMADGRKFEYAYFRERQNIIKESNVIDPNGLMTSFLYSEAGYRQSLPTLPPDSPLRSQPPSRVVASRRQ
jgi:YD repeat-containing protein